MNTEQLVATLENPSGWVRDKAQQMLIWKNDGVAAAAAGGFIQAHKSPQARLQALCTLDALNALQPATIEAASKMKTLPFAPRHPIVRNPSSIARSRIEARENGD